jgi:hydroxymethylglutaryl-CoA lyase
MKLPNRVMIREEGPRDGWQNLDQVIPTEQKIAYIEALVDAGATHVAVTGLVHPKWVPQLADAEAVLRALERRPGVQYGVLVPNERGFGRLQRLLDEGVPVDHICTVISASEAHNQANVNMSIDESMRQLEPVVKAAKAAGLEVTGGMGMAFGCCFEGPVPEARVIDIARRYADMGCDDIVLGDTTGMANPVLVAERASAVRDAIGSATVTLHFHNTRGAALANVLAALQVGIDRFEAAYGELGGCQFAAGATGNLATEDLVSMLHEMGIDTGYDLPKLLDVARDTASFLNRQLDSHVVRAGPVEWTPRPDLRPDSAPAASPR